MRGSKGLKPASNTPLRGRSPIKIPLEQIPTCSQALITRITTSIQGVTLYPVELASCLIHGEPLLDGYWHCNLSLPLKVSDTQESKIPYSLISHGSLTVKSTGNNSENSYPPWECITSDASYPYTCLAWWWTRMSQKPYCILFLSEIPASWEDGVRKDGEAPSIPNRLVVAPSYSFTRHSIQPYLSEKLHSILTENTI